MKKSKYWTRTLEIKKLVYHDYRKALNFSSSKSSIKDLELVHVKIAALSIKSDLVSLKALKKRCSKYSNFQFDNLITRLKMLGEIYDPYLRTNKSKEGKIVMLL